MKNVSRSATAITFLMLAFTTGCGGGGNAPAPGLSANLKSVTRASESQFSKDALILASQRSTEPRISADEAKRIDAELIQIRDKFAAVKDIHTLSEYDLHQMIVSLESDASWAAKWRQGDMATGVAGLDALLSKYHLTKVQTSPYYADSNTFILTFEDPLNIPALAHQMEQISASFASVNRNLTTGDGNRIALQTADGKRVYAFSQGWGDCPAGCISRHFWKVTLDSSNNLTLEESGPATLPQ